MMCFRMVDLVAGKKDRLAALCVGFGVVGLGLFGSAARDDFDESSDLDFVVEVVELAPEEHARSYFGLLRELEALFAQSGLGRGVGGS